MTNKGLKIDANLRKLAQHSYFMPLNYTFGSSVPENARKVGICLQNQGDGTYARTNPERLLLEPPSTTYAQQNPTQVYLSKHLKAEAVRALRTAQHLEFKFSYERPSIFTVGAIEPRSQWNAMDEVFVIPSEHTSFVGYQQVCGTGSGKEAFLVICGYNAPDYPWICLVNSLSNQPLYNAAKLLDIDTTTMLGREDGNRKLKLGKWGVVNKVRVSLTTTVIREVGMETTRFQVDVN